MMPVQMIRCDIEKRAYFRTKCTDRLQLKTAHFRDCDRIFRHLFHYACIWISDISDYKCMRMPVADDLAEQRRCRRLSVRSGNRKNFPFSICISKFDLTPDRKMFRRIASTIGRSVGTPGLITTRVSVSNTSSGSSPRSTCTFSACLPPVNILHGAVLCPVSCSRHTGSPGHPPGKSRRCCRDPTDPGTEYQYVFSFYIHLLYPHQCDQTQDRSSDRKYSHNSCL